VYFLPAEWHLKYETRSGWTKISANYSLKVTNNPEEIKFLVITTKSLRAVFTASGSSKFGGFGIKEWEALSPTAF
jgi:hypothetical protein